MVELKAISYEESRLEYFRKQRDSAKRRMNYWCGAKQADRVGWMEASDRASEASAQYNFYKDALKALENQPKWISVEDRLPKELEDVLAYVRNNEVSWLCVSYMYDGMWWKSCNKICGKVTHWMPLPSMHEPPKEDA